MKRPLKSNVLLRSIRVISLLAAAYVSVLLGEAGAQNGEYFSKKKYLPQPLAQWSETRDKLPAPIDDEHPLWIKLYWKAWELAFAHFHEPGPHSAFVSQFIESAFNENTAQWDSSFMSMFCDYGYPLVPGVSSLDNFYARQYSDGEICREINWSTGLDFKEWDNTENRPLFSQWGWPLSPLQDLVRTATPVIYKGRPVPSPNPRVTLDGLNHPIFAWAELEHYAITGDRTRLKDVWPPLVHYYRALKKYLRQGNGLYVTDWASMDNSPRNYYLREGGTGIDISAEMVLFARQLAQIGKALGKVPEASQFSSEADDLARTINQKMWDEKQKFYFDLSLDEKLSPVKTIAAYWTLLGRVASPEQAAYLVSQLKNPQTFGRRNPVPTLAAHEAGYKTEGGYWQGSVWIPTDKMVIEGLEEYGYGQLSREIALKHLSLVARVFEETGTIWENYSADFDKPGEPAKPDFVGWSGLAPIEFLLRYDIGLKPDAPHNELQWTITSNGRVGCERFRFGGHVASLLAEPTSSGAMKERLSVESDGPFTLYVLYNGVAKSLSVHPGKQKYEM
jgi:hypothetical protein